MKSSEIQLGVNVLDPTRRQLTGENGQPVELRYQSMSVLLTLAQWPGEIVTRDTIVENVWPETHVSEDSLAQCIADIRRALGDVDKRLVETVPRKGYRLVPNKAPKYSRSKLTVSALLVVIAMFAGIGYWITRSGYEQENPVVAVLPLDDLSTTDHSGYLSDALSEGIITELARFPQFKVIARNSSFQFRGRPTDIREIGKVLNADYVVEGSQQYDGKDLRVSIQLLETRSGTHVFADKFDRELDEFFAVQDEIVRQVATKVGGSLLTDIPKNQTNRDVTPLLRSLAARKLMRRPTKENWAKAMALEVTSMQEDPASAWGYIGTALMLRAGLFEGWIDRPRDEVLREATGLAQKSLEIAPNNYMSHYASARILATQKDYPRSLLHFERAVQLNPSDSIVLVAMSLPLLFSGETERAKSILLQAKSVDPLHSDWLLWQLGWAYWQNHECEKGLDAMMAMSAPPAASLSMLAALQVCLGELDQARKTMTAFLESRPGYSLADEIRLNPQDWKPEGTRERWLDSMRRAGMPG